MNLKIILSSIAITIISVIASVGIIFAQEAPRIPEDTADCKDHFFITRMPGYIMVTCDEITAPGSILLDLGQSSGLQVADSIWLKEVGARRTEFQYHYLATVEDKQQPTHKEVLEHYEKTSLKTAQIVYLFDKPTFHGATLGAVYQTRKNNRTYWIIIMLGTGEPSNYSKKNSGHQIRIIETTQKRLSH